MSDNGVRRFWKIPDQAGIFFLCVARGCPIPPTPCRRAGLQPRGLHTLSLLKRVQILLDILGTINERPVSYQPNTPIIIF